MNCVDCWRCTTMIDDWCRSRWLTTMYPICQYSLVAGLMHHKHRVTWCIRKLVTYDLSCIIERICTQMYQHMQTNTQWMHFLWMQVIEAHIDHDSDSGSSRNSRGDDIRSMCAAIIITRTTSRIQDTPKHDQSQKLCGILMTQKRRHTTDAQSDRCND